MRPAGTLKQFTLLETEEAIFFIKQNFQKYLADSLNLTRVSAPLFVDAGSGIQDNLNGTEAPIYFNIPFIDREGQNENGFEIIHSLAKWKRYALYRYNIPAGQGIYTDMNALRPGEPDLKTAMHSVYVDQWDWEKTINHGDRKITTLKGVVEKIYGCIKKMELDLHRKYQIQPVLPEAIRFIHSEDLLRKYPRLPARKREREICRKLGAVFIIGIGGLLADKTLHDGRAPDYDDWSTLNEDGQKGLNGDLLVYNPVLNREFELSSMGIRVNKGALIRQLRIRKNEERMGLPWHQLLLNNDLPQSIGGGIGQSRLCMFLLRKRHIGEVQVSCWPESVIEESNRAGIQLL